MSDVMLLGVLEMPLDMVVESRLSLIQYHSRAQEAAARIRSDAKYIQEMELALKTIMNGCDSPEKVASAALGRS